MTATDSSTAVADKVAVAALWGGVRIIVIDTETTCPPGGGPLRAVSLAAVTCRAGTVRGKWETLVNPGIPVDRNSLRIHGITDEHLVGEPTFADVSGLLLPMLEQRDGERLVLAGHNIRFDIAVLRTELALIGLELPDIALLDTMGKLPALVDVRPTGSSLVALLGALGIINSRPHQALADAVACAEALVALLDLAAARGHTDFDSLLAEVSGSSTTLTVTANGTTRASSKGSTPALPTAHLEGHATLLSRRAGRKMLDHWHDQVAECAVLRCRHLDDRIAQTEAPPLLVLAQAEKVLAERAAAGDTAGAATVLNAMLPLLDHLPPGRGRLGFRSAPLAWAKHWSALLAPLSRCRDDDRCQCCHRGEPCALDTWFDTIARLALGDTGQYARGFFEPTGREAGTGAYTNWTRTGTDPRIADAAVWLCVEHWRAVGQSVRAEQITQLAWNAGCRHPDVADAYTGQLAAAGRLPDLTAAALVCDQALVVRAGSTHEGWTRLSARQNQLGGRQQRLTFRPSGKLDEDGNPIPLRRHHPDAPRRTRPTRFLRH